MSGAPATPLLGIGEVRHRRLRPVAHAFVYPTYFLLLPMRRPARAARAGAAPQPLRPAQLPRRATTATAAPTASPGWRRCSRAKASATATGEVWLQCYPRILGFTFKPVSFWYCHRRDGTLAAVVVEVNNTFGERHCYLLSGPRTAFGRELRAEKRFHVSPFCAVEGDYRFRFLRRDAAPHDDGSGRGRPARILARVDHHDAAGVLLETRLSGTLEPLDRRRIARAFVTVPLLTLGVVVRIHWQALRLFCKRVPFRRKPEAPPSFVTR